MGTVRRLLSHLSAVRHETGQMLVLTAVGLVGFIGIVGLSIDVGQVVLTRTDLQKVADAAALAGAQDLPTAGAAATSANTYVGLNAGNTSAVIQITSTHNTNDTIEVTAKRKIGFTFLRIVGLEGADVSAKAKVRVGTYSGGKGLTPWGLVASNNKDFLGNSCFNGFDGNMPTFKQNQRCVLKYGAGTNSGGDFGPLALDGTGASEYRDDIIHGSNAEFVAGQQVEVQTGNMQGPTAQGITDLLSSPQPATCQTDNRDEILKTTAGKTSIVDGCEAHPRIIIIPVVDKIANPDKSTILGFAFMFLHGKVGGGGSSTIEAEFVTFVTAIPGGIYNGSGTGSTMIRMVE